MKQFWMGLVAGIALTATITVGARDEPEVVAFINGNKLYSDMSSDEVSLRMASMGYVAGATDMFRVFEAIGADMGRTEAIACIPREVSISQTRDVVKVFLENNPQERHNSAASIIGAALEKAFPCSPEQ